MKEFKLIVHESDAKKVDVQLQGSVNEHADFSLYRIPGDRPMNLDLSGMTAINSIGIREFCNWSVELENPIIEVSFVPKFFVAQLNILPHLLPKRAKVVSFYVPYYSEELDEESQFLCVDGVHVKVVDGQLTVNLPVVTDSQGNEMSMDIIPERYFNFLKRS